MWQASAKKTEGGGVRCANGERKKWLRPRADAPEEPLEAPLDAPLDAPADFDDPAEADGTGLVGTSTAFGSLRRLADAVAGRRCTVLLNGETGSGKELFARHLHDQGDRPAGPFVAVDCSALSETLFESQLFGHAKGAFTGAGRDSVGFVRAADGGTLFLDEVGELPPGQQAKLLRMLQERSVTPVGEHRPVAVDVRVVCATHRDLEAMVAAGTFRQDLYYRIAVVTLRVPPLRERPGDVAALATHFLSRQATFYGETAKTLSPEASAALASHPWPGNVRELANAMEHAHVLCEGPVVTPGDLPATISRPRAAIRASELCLESMERRTIAEAMRRTHGRKGEACRLLGINLQRLNRKLDKLEIALPARGGARVGGV